MNEELINKFRFTTAFYSIIENQYLSFYVMLKG